MTNSKWFWFVAAVAGLFFSRWLTELGAPAAISPPAYAYSDYWLDNPPGEILVALGRNGVMGCGIAGYRENLKHHGEFAVRCIDAYDIKRYYLVWLPLGKVQGPVSLESLLEQ